MAIRSSARLVKNLMLDRFQCGLLDLFWRWIIQRVPFKPAILRIPDAQVVEPYIRMRRFKFDNVAFKRRFERSVSSIGHNRPQMK